MAAMAPGKVEDVPVQRWRPIRVGDRVEVTLRPCTVALDGERSFSLLEGQTTHVCLSPDGPRVVSIDAALGQASMDGVFRDTS